jgi:uncharacterized repeat protein (TIGR03806 family)
MTLVLMTTWASVHAQSLGTIRRDLWTGVGGSAIRDLTDLAAFPDSPSSSGSITLFEGPTNTADNYGSRIVGYVHPGITGAYTFWLAGDDNCELWLSTDETPDHRQRIAQVPAWTNSRDWTKYPEQQSAPITLESGRFYFIEALHKEGSGGDNLAVAWTPPGGSGQTVLPGAQLSPPEPLPPVVSDDAATLNPGAKVLLQVLRNDGDPNGFSDLDVGSLTLEQAPLAGSVFVDTQRGEIRYTHTGAGTGQDSFTYTIRDQAGAISPEATVTLDITDEPRIVNTSLDLPLQSPAMDYELVDRFPGMGFSNPLALRSPPGSGTELYVVEKAGRIQRFADVSVPATTVFLDISSTVIDSGEEGLLSMAFHPNYASNGYFFVFYTLNISADGYDRLSRFTVSADPALADAGSEVVLFSQRDQKCNHNGGDLHFGPDGYLYVSLGDEGGGDDSFNNSQRIDKDFFSGILRIDVDRLPGNLEPNGHASVSINGQGTANYKVPFDNPWVGATSFNDVSVNPAEVITEFYAVGLRNPWRMAFDPVTAELWVGDVGQGTREEVNKVVKGGNYGWGYREGFIAGPKTPPANPVYEDPVWDCIRSLGRSITGGVVSRGVKLPALYGAYIVADYATGNIWSLREEPGGLVDRIIASETRIVGLGYDPSNGDILLCDYNNDMIWVLAASSGQEAIIYPATLSDTGVFADLSDLSPNPGIVAYEVNLPSWKDHAQKRRWFSVPGPALIHYSADEAWAAPTGTVWVKHFELELERGNPTTATRVETRLLVKWDDGVYGLSYAWNAAGDEAFLVPEGGTNIVYSIDDGGIPIDQTWTIPGRNACLNCHTEAGGFTLSFNTRQLNREAPIFGSPANQLGALSQAGYFDQPVQQLEVLPRFAGPDDPSQSLEYRVRSYLAVNCVHCHQAGGPTPAAFDTRAALTLFETGLIDGAVQVSGGDPAKRLVVPGDLANSVLLHRLQAVSGAGRMPPLGPNLHDPQAIQLLVDWINTESTNHPGYVEWAIREFGSVDHPDAQVDDNPDGDPASNYVEFLTRTDPQVANPPWRISFSADGSTSTVHFLRQPNTGFEVEISDDLINWSPWNVPANRPVLSGGAAFMDTIDGPIGPLDARYYRMRVYER